MTRRSGKELNKERISGYDYESAYSDAEKATLDVKEDQKRRAAGEYVEEGNHREKVKVRQEARKAARTRRFVLIGALAAACIVAIAIVVVLNAAKEPEKEEEGIAQLEVSDQKASVEKLYTYGTHLNMQGTLPAEAVTLAAECKVDLVLYNGDFISVPIIIDEGTFTLSEEYNGGLYLDTIARDTYTMFIRVTSEKSFEEETESVSEETTEAEVETTTGNALQKKKTEETTTEETSEAESETDNLTEKYYKYYPLVNNTDYQETTYYTMSKYNNCIVIGNEYTYPTVQMVVAENTNDEAADVVLDAGRGGTDLGATGVDGHREADFLLPLTLKIKSDLEEKGIKVALTRTSDNETVDPYGEDGRIARACKTNAKYMISIRMNSAGGSGLEVYAYTGLDYTFAQTLNEKIQEATGLGDSTSAGSIGNNIYCKLMSQSDIDEEKADNKEAGLKEYEPTLESSYYYIIRESGGIVTGAFKDDRNPKEEYNPYCYSNTGIETYVVQLGNVTSEGDVKIMSSKSDEMAAAIADALVTVY